MAWLESTALAEWVRTSLVGYPLVLTVHSIGMAIMVGLVAVVDLRLAGWLQRIPYASLVDVLRIAWYGLAANVITGVALFTSQAVAYSTNPTYLLKMLMVACGVILAAYMQPVLRRNAAGWVSGAPIPGQIRMLALLSLVIWLVAIVTGRFVAYV